MLMPFVDRPGASIWVSLTLLASVVATVQVGDRLDLFAQPVLTGSDKSMEQYESFRAHVERDGHHDLVVLGNSIARQSLDIQQLQRELEPALGRRLVGYNFGAGGTPPNALDVVAGLVYGIDDPEICVIVMTARMLAAWDDQMTDRGGLMHTSPYGQAILDPIAWRGAIQRWLLDNVALARMRYGVREVVSGDPPARRTRGGYDSALGYLATRKGTATEESWERVRERLANAPFDLKGRPEFLLEQIRGIQAKGAEVWLVEGALHPRRLVALPDPSRNLADARRMLRQIADATGARALLIPPDLRFSQSDFGDTSHLDPEAAARYSSWVAAELAQDLSALRRAR